MTSDSGLSEAGIVQAPVCHLPGTEKSLLLYTYLDNLEAIQIWIAYQVYCI
jgi:hypothetical protein